jgi:hypothetical protein
MVLHTKCNVVALKDDNKQQQPKSVDAAAAQEASCAAALGWPWDGESK